MVGFAVVKRTQQSVLQQFFVVKLFASMCEVKPASARKLYEPRKPVLSLSGENRIGQPL